MTDGRVDNSSLLDDPYFRPVDTQYWRLHSQKSVPVDRQLERNRTGSFHQSSAHSLTSEQNEDLHDLSSSKQSDFPPPIANDMLPPGQNASASEQKESDGSGQICRDPEQITQWPPGVLPAMRPVEYMFDTSPQQAVFAMPNGSRAKVWRCNVLEW